MTDERHVRKDLDDLLKRAFADDLPADVAAGMRERIGRFRAGTVNEGKGAAVWALLFRRSVWAVLSILMLVSGMLLQGLGSRSTLAERISLIKTEIASAESARRPSVASGPRLIDPDGLVLTRRNNHGRDS